MPITGYFSGHTCGDACWHARDMVCVCSCGGKNHGILARGEAQPTRTAKIGGAMYELVEIGDHRSIEGRRLAEVRACGHHWFFDPCGPWLAKPATKSQLKLWPELQPFESGAYILWRAA